MPGPAPLNGVGYQPASDLFVPSTERLHPLGMTISAFDPYYGYGEFVYGKAAAAQECGSIVRVGDEVYTMEDYPNTANLGGAFLVAKCNMPADSFGWYQKSGLVPVSVTASVAEDVAIGITGAGTAGANTAGKQLLGVQVKKASTHTITKVGTTFSGTKRILLADVDGLVHNLTVSGTGVPASSEITAITSNNEITMSENATASGTVTLTFTFTGFVVLYMQNPTMQGAIT